MGQVFMRRSVLPIFLVTIAVAFSCDSSQSAFDESLPGFYTLTTQVSPDGGGTLQPSGGEFLSGNGVQIVARPAEGYVFDRWEGDLTGNSNPNFIGFNSNKTVIAHFTRRNFNLNLTIVGGGTVRETVVDQASTVTVELVAEAEEGWSFNRWEGDLSGNNNPETMTIEEGEQKSVTAIFLEDSAAEYTLSVTVEGEGSVDKNPDNSSYTAGDQVTLTANAAIGWMFKEWQGALSGSSNPGTVLIDDDKQVTAIFAVDPDFGITIQEVKLFIKEMELGGARRTRDYKIKDFILNLPLDGSPFQITHVQIPSGFYDEVELDIKKPGKSVTIDDSDFIDGSNRYSLVVNGVFNGADFTFRSDEDFQIDVDLNPHLEITRTKTSIIGITVDFEGWFRGEGGAFLDPNDSRNAERINKNIEDSFSDFEDGF
jgi:hypothetical protein